MIYNPESVLRAVEECDRLGRTEFLQKYGFSPAKSYHLIHNGKEYDSKAIVGVAYGFENPDHGPLRAEEFSGGAATVQNWLEDLGFEVRVAAPALPDEIIEPQRYIEGAVKRISVNSYERNPEARRKCIEHFGLNCAVCGFNFRATYGELGEGYIHVHHLRDLASIGEEYEVDPIEDLRPVCPNCHAMLHRPAVTMSIEELKGIVGDSD
tara:strand:+ start:889 stop:1515 length:627 start_codon:yes stop_codon:yes gene_type:complete